MKRKYLRFGIIIGLLVASALRLNAQVTPEIQLGARGVMSFNTDVVSDKTTTAANDFSDTAVLLGFRQKLYNRFRGQLVIGFQFPDADSDLGQLFFHQTFLKIEDKKNILKMGRSRVRSALIEFPTLRDDDALVLTDVLNPYSSGENSEDNQYGNVIELAHVFAQRYWLRVHGEHFTRTPVAPAVSETDFSLNALGFSFQYRVPESQLWNRPVLQQLGFNFNSFLTDNAGYTHNPAKTLKNYSLSAIVNLKRDPVHFWDLRAQAIFNNGIDAVTTLQSFRDMAMARSVAIFGSLRYLLRRLERPSLQLALSAGFKKYNKLRRTGEHWQMVGNGFYRLGENFDAGLQVQYSRFSGSLADLLGKSEYRFQFALSYSIDQVWNNQFDDRGSLLNLEHGYIQ